MEFQMSDIPLDNPDVAGVLVRRLKECDRSLNAALVETEPMMSMETIAAAALAMLTLPPDVNFLEAIVLPRNQAYLGRG